MPYEIDWYQEGRIVYERAFGATTMQDVEAGGEALAEFIRAGRPPLVHVIVDMTDVERLPIGLNLNTANALVGYMKEPLLGWMVVVGGSGAARFIASMLAQIARVRFRSVDTLDDALAFLQSVDETLGDLAADKRPL